MQCASTHRQGKAPQLTRRASHPPSPPRRHAREANTASIADELDRLEPALLQKRWRSVMGRPAPKSLSRQLMIRILLWREQTERWGDIDASTRATLAAALRADNESLCARESALAPRPGSVLVREHGGMMNLVMVLDRGYAWNGRDFASLSAAARAITGTKWNGRRFFGLDRKIRDQPKTANAASCKAASKRFVATKTAQVAQVATRAGRKEGPAP